MCFERITLSMSEVRSNVSVLEVKGEDEKMTRSKCLFSYLLSAQKLKAASYADIRNPLSQSIQKVVSKKAR